MAMTTTYEEDVEVIDERDPYFIGRTDQWPDHPDGQIVLGYYGKFMYIMPVDYFEILGDSEEYNERDADCGKHNCIGSGILSAPRGSDLCELDWCSGCHDKAKEGWQKLLKSNPELGVSHLI